MMQYTLIHPNIVKLLAVCMNPFSLISEYIPFGNLYNYINDYSRNISWKMKLKIASDIAQVMNYMHTLNPPIAHLDLKSPNVMLTSLDPNSEVVAKITDFGLSKVSLGGFSGKFADNPIWLAPEILRNEQYDVRVDNYAFGIILWELVERKKGFEDIPYLWKISELVVSGTRLHLGDCPEIIRELITNCWTDNRVARPSFSTILTILNNLKNNMDWDLWEAKELEKLENTKSQGEPKGEPKIPTYNDSFLTTSSDIDDKFRISRLDDNDEFSEICDWDTIMDDEAPAAEERLVRIRKKDKEHHKTIILPNRSESESPPKCKTTRMRSNSQSYKSVIKERHTPRTTVHFKAELENFEAIPVSRKKSLDSNKAKNVTKPNGNLPNTITTPAIRSLDSLHIIINNTSELFGNSIDVNLVKEPFSQRVSGSSKTRREKRQKISKSWSLGESTSPPFPLLKRHSLPSRIRENSTDRYELESFYLFDEE
uniref:Protein kinase domain-containing protein n=1 Tax=Arcella intermedia TaxID=1963864 RepID=A0A6B2L2K1_9EUKA